MVRQAWEGIGARFARLQSEELVVMPNHLHGILRIRAGNDVPLGVAVGDFKGLTTAAYGVGVRTRSWRPYEGRLWQRNYWERILRNEDEVLHARHYILMNPAHWATDPLHR